MSLDGELTVEMEEFASMRERMAALRKKNKTFHSNKIDKLWKMGEKYPVYKQGPNIGPDNANLEATEEEDDEEIIYKPPFLEMRVEMQRRQDLPPPGFAANAADGRPPIYFPSSNMDPAQNQPSTPAQNPSYAEHDVHSSELDRYEKQEKEWREKEEVKIDIKEEIKKAMKDPQCIPDIAEFSYEDLCIHPNLDLPEGFKIPKFDTFGGVGNPMAHLRAYCDQLVGVGRDEALLMRLFSRSLCGEAPEWFTSHETRQWPSWNALAKDFINQFDYNVEIVRDRYSLDKMKQKSTESYREFAYRWRKEAARVRPPMSEKEIVEVVVRVQKPEYYDRIMLLFRLKFAEIIKIGETIEDGLKSEKIARVAASPGSSGLLKKKREEIASGVSPNYANVQSSYRAPPPVYQVQAPLYRNSPSNYQAPSPNYQTNPYPRSQDPHPYSRSYQQVPPLQQDNYDPPRPRFEKKPSRNFTTLTKSRIKLYEQLAAAGYIHHVGPEPVDDLIDKEAVSLQTAAPNVITNPFPNHGGGNVNMIETDDDWCGTKKINQIVHDDLEKAVASLSIKEKKKFVILTPVKAVSLVPSKTLIKPKFVVVTTAAQGMT
ncbi:uncharacterized protein LOC107009834 [Solanum pennellii]|uniref:Uncharacterized protein LOC107009834 n=1 Tax=Solanum pennellii TaxID=28526 RepID=A0ABM1G1K5_SOLPN|nr:uncharacterized protein LOC107009834 [Solanum pennellii]